MGKKLFIGNLSYNTTEDTLREKLSTFGEVVSLKIIMDRFSGRSKGFGFVEMATDEAGDQAISELNGQDLDGREIVVREDEPQMKKDRPFRSNGGGMNRRSGGDFNRREYSN